MKNPYQHNTYKMTPGERQNADELQRRCDYMSGLNDADFFEFCKLNNLKPHLYGGNAREKSNES